MLGPIGRLAVVVGMAVAALAIVARLREVGPERVAWEERVPTAGQRPVLLDFTADWCPACQDMRRNTWTDASVAAAISSAGCVPVHVDADLHPDLGRRYGVEYLPTLVLTDADGREQRRSVGYLAPADFRRWLAGDAR